MSEYKHLRVLFKDNGSLKCAAEHLARKAFYLLKSKLPFSNDLSPKSWLKIYESIITPIFIYAYAYGWLILI